MEDHNKRVPPSGTTRPVDSVGPRSPAEDGLTPARRRLLRILGRGAGATAALLPIMWSRPVVESVLLPAHAQTSVATCSVQVVWFNDSNDDEICLVIEAEGAADPLPLPGDCILSDNGTVQGTFDQELPPGSYSIIMSANFDEREPPETREEDFAGTVTCCNGDSQTFDGNLEGPSGGTASQLVAVVTITDDGECSIAVPG